MIYGNMYMLEDCYPSSKCPSRPNSVKKESSQFFCLPNNMNAMSSSISKSLERYLALIASDGAAAAEVAQTCANESLSEAEAYSSQIIASGSTSRLAERLTKLTALLETADTRGPQGMSELNWFHRLVSFFLLVPPRSHSQCDPPSHASIKTTEEGLYLLRMVRNCCTSGLEFHRAVLSASLPSLAETFLATLAAHLQSFPGTPPDAAAEKVFHQACVATLQLLANLTMEDDGLIGFFEEEAIRVCRTTFAADSPPPPASVLHPALCLLCACAG